MTNSYSTRCKGLLDWYRQHGRILPWRQTREPYAIWISEVMLQQTQVKTVLPRYRQWFEYFPSIASLAEADLDDVLKAWEGLGYYRRARFIHRSATIIMADYAGHFPDSFEDILKLPGIGRSTAGAIASFCFGTAKPVLDGNVKRVLRRWQGVATLPDRALWQLAEQAIDESGAAASWNQAMMELGATHCRARSPDCGGCPVAEWCRAAFCVDQVAEQQGVNRVAVRDLHWQVQLFRCPDRGLWLEKRADTGIWAGLWSPPIVNLDEAPDALPRYVHQLTHRRLHLYPHYLSEAPKGAGCWVDDLEGYALPTGIHRLLEVL